MHELSIARALLRLVEEHCPADATVETVHIRVGPLQAIVPDAMALAWQAVTFDHSLAHSELQLEMLPWRMQCLQCHREWEAETPFQDCTCGSRRCVPRGGDELQLEYLEIEESCNSDNGRRVNAVESTVMGESR